MNILEKIMLHKAQEVAERKKKVSTQELEKKINEQPTKTNSLKNSLLKQNSSGVIAEFKRQSPSKGIINDNATPQEVARGYTSAGVTGMSVLTDTAFFGGKTADLEAARQATQIPILRKDFMLDTYQILEAKAMQADVILLIAAAINPLKAKELASFAKSMGLEVLLEVHDETELKTHLCPEVDLVGVNNRNLKTFSVSIENSLRLANKIPAEFVKISESGLSDPRSIRELRQAGFKGFLMGEAFMKTQNPMQACQEFIQKILSMNNEE